jgi:hypothetical protein
MKLKNNDNKMCVWKHMEWKNKEVKNPIFIFKIERLKNEGIHGITRIKVFF